MSAELEEKIREVYEIFTNKYLFEVLEIFKREFSEENVELKQNLISFDSFLRAFLDHFYIYDIDREEVKVCSEEYADNWGYDFLYNLVDGTESGEYSLDSLFESLDINDLFDTLDDYVTASNIYVHFPLVKITNERGQYTYAKHMFAKVPVTNRGLMTSERFLLNRSHYSYAHFINNYMHSHVYQIPTSNFERFSDCCTGSGPINDTMNYLRNDYSEAEWMQFCWDLAKYITVESEEGGPYHHLKRCNVPFVKGSEINITDLYVELGCQKAYLHKGSLGAIIPNTFWKDFIQYLIVNKIVKFRWANKQWQIAECPSDYVKIISNAFLEFCKENIDDLCSRGITIENLLNHEYLKKVYIDLNGIFTFTGNGLSSIIESARGRKVLTFKGVDYNVEIEDAPTEALHTQVILDVKIIAYITGCLLKILNTQYGKRNANNPSEPENPFKNF